MQIQFIGTGDAFCSGGRFQTCFLVKLPEFCFLIDCGATSMMAFKAGDISSNSIDGIVISHFHGDHYGGLPFLLLDANFNQQRTRPLSILGPVGIASRVGELMSILYPGVDLNKLSFAVEFKEFPESGQRGFGPLLIESYPVVHVPESSPHGIRIMADDKILSFSGDTGWTENLYKIANSADLFICECNFYHTVVPSHLNYLTIVAEMENLPCKRIILNHLGSEMLDHLSEVELDCSYDGLTLEI